MRAVVDDSKEVETSADERSETDKLVDGMDFGELCNDFECISSPYVESTARRLARDILELREGNRAFNCYAVSVKYKVQILPISVLFFTFRSNCPLLRLSTRFSSHTCRVQLSYMPIMMVTQCMLSSFRTLSGHLLGVKST